MITSTFVVAGESAQDRLTAMIEAEVQEFCQSVHGTSGSLSREAIQTAPRSGSGPPHILVDHRGFQCAGIENASLLQGGFCGLTMDGMKCLVKVFEYRKSRYVETTSYLR